MVDAADLLTIDCGNSTLDCLRHADGARLRLPSDGTDLSLLGGLVEGRRIRRCVAASVVANGLTAVLPFLARCGIGVRVAGIDLHCPLRLDYDTPHTLGVDRWLGALAAHRRCGGAVVVDCGSATTLNLVEHDGTFRGGPIAPGLRAFAAGMSAVTPALPPVHLDGVVEMPSRTSQKAVDTGVLLGYAGLVERLVAGLLAAARGPASVIVTGGNAARLLRHSRLRAAHEPDLVHIGLRHLADGAP